MNTARRANPVGRRHRWPVGSLLLALLVALVPALVAHRGGPPLHVRLVAARPRPAGSSIIAATPDGGGYWMAGPAGQVDSFGDAGSYGSPVLMGLSVNDVVGMASTPDGAGYWLVGADGGIFSFGDAGFHGSTGGLHLNAPVVGMASTPDGAGYWLVASDGGIFSFGDARFYGSTGGLHLNAPVVGMASTPDGAGYRLVASDGGIFSFGDAGFYGSTGSLHLNAPVVGMAPTPDGVGYWLVASDGGIFSFGDARFFGSAGGLHLNAPVGGMASAPDGAGYWLAASDGGVFTYGDAAFHGAASWGIVSTGVGWTPQGLQGPVPAPGACHYRAAADGYALQDPSCTPGAVNAAVTQADIHSTICSSGYTSSVRPPVTLTEPAKFRSMDGYASPGSAGGYEYDHLVPLELGGSSDVRNLWPEPNAGSPSQFDSTDGYGINAKDGVEDRLNAAVCSGQVTLAAAQAAIVANWTTAEASLGVAP